MKFIHLSDLHLGKRVNGYAMLEDQKYILTQIINIIDAEDPDGILIAGDVYDQSVPSAEAVSLFDDFLVRLAGRHLPVWIISGNHDSAERLAFANRLLDVSGIHLSPVYNGMVAPVVMEDAFGPVNIYMLPFIKPVTVRRFFPDQSINTYTEAVSAAIDAMAVDPAARNVLITHQFVTGAATSESEEISVGGTDNVDASVFAAFDYVALGHLHRPQNVGTNRIRYCGTPLKYSFSECSDYKSVSVVELKEKGDLEIRTIPLKPLREMVVLKADFETLMDPAYYANTTWQEDYTHLILTDEQDVPDAPARLRTVYHRIMKISCDNTRTRHVATVEMTDGVDERAPIELFSDLYQQQNGVELDATQRDYLQDLIEGIWDGEVTL